MSIPAASKGDIVVVHSSDLHADDEIAAMQAGNVALGHWNRAVRVGTSIEREPIRWE